MGETQGTATKMKATGKAKCVSHGLPPIFQIKAEVMETAIAACSHPSGRQSGFPISKRRNGNSAANASRTVMAATMLPFRPATGRGSGRLSQRSQKRYAAKNGTNQP